MNVGRSDGIGWLALMMSVIGLASILHSERVGATALLVSFVLGIAGVARARSGWGRTASALAILIILLLGLLASIAADLSNP